MINFVLFLGDQLNNISFEIIFSLKCLAIQQPAALCTYFSDKSAASGFRMNGA